MLLVEISIWPMDKGMSVGPYVAKALDVIDRSGLSYKVGPMGTCIEGPYEDVMAVVKHCHEVLMSDCDRIVCQLKMDWRRDASGRIEGKVNRVESLLGRSISK
jgi:uncharacterized protein (TIGR00106 family)